MPDIGRTLLVPGFILGALAGSEAAVAQELPRGVNPEMVDRGERIYAEGRLCTTCHGPRGTGIPDLGSDLTDGVWLYADGSYAGLARVIDRGVTAEESITDMPMPPAGGARLDREQIAAVAAYIWTLER